MDEFSQTVRVNKLLSLIVEFKKVAVVTDAANSLGWVSAQRGCCSSWAGRCKLLIGYGEGLPDSEAWSCSVYGDDGA
jgi:hypothetical protein